MSLEQLILYGVRVIHYDPFFLFTKKNNFVKIQKDTALKEI